MNNIPTYTEYTEGKKLTVKQHRKRMAEYEKLYGKVDAAGNLIEAKEEEVQEVARTGQCKKCFNGGFGLKVVNNQIQRTCMKCGNIDYV